MCLLETAAQAITDTASGRELLSGVASAKGVLQDRTTGMEARMMGEASMATCGMDPSEANDIVDRIVMNYERNYHEAPMGKKFQECYDVADIAPMDEYLDVYDRALMVLSDCGIDF
jgi:methylamine--corrinoid protein Co-methyltransferase